MAWARLDLHRVSDNSEPCNSYACVAALFCLGTRALWSFLLPGRSGKVFMNK